MKDLIITFVIALVCTSIYNEIKYTSHPLPAQDMTEPSDPPAAQASSNPGGDQAAQTGGGLSASGDVFAPNGSGAPVPGMANVVSESSDMPLMDEVGFDRDVIKSASPVLVFFCSNSSPPCHEVYSSVQSAATQLEDFRVVRVDVQAHPTLAQVYGVSMVPTFMIFKDGRKINQYTGVMPTQDLIALARKSLTAS